MGSVDVIIPVYKPGEEFNELIRRLLKQTKKPERIIIIQTVPDDYIGELLQIKVESSAGDNDVEFIVRAVEQSDFDHGASRNFGAFHSKADYMLFMTQDAIPADKVMIENLLKSFEISESVAISYARQLPKKDADIVERLSRKHNYPEKSRLKTSKDVEELGIHTYFCSDVCAMYKRKLFYEMGEFVNPTTFNEDMLMAYKMIEEGYSVMYCADARVLHSHNYNAVEQFRRYFDNGVSHNMHREVFESVSAEKAGASYAKDVAKTLVKNGQFLELASFTTHCAAKYAGLKLGENYTVLPKAVVDKLTLNKAYWNKNYNSNRS